MCPPRIKYYNNVLFHSVRQNFIVQTGDPTGTGKGGSSIDGCASKSTPPSNIVLVVQGIVPQPSPAGIAVWL